MVMTHFLHFPSLEKEGGSNVLLNHCKLPPLLSPAVDDASEVGSIVNKDDGATRVLNPLNPPPLLSPVVGNASEPGSVSGDDVAMRT